jgi:hypothetical protein
MECGFSKFNTVWIEKYVNVSDSVLASVHRKYRHMLVLLVSQQVYQYPEVLTCGLFLCCECQQGQSILCDILHCFQFHRHCFVCMFRKKYTNIWCLHKQLLAQFQHALQFLNSYLSIYKMSLPLILYTNLTIFDLIIIIILATKWNSYFLTS